MGWRTQHTGCPALVLLYAAAALCFCFFAQQAHAQDLSGLSSITVLRQVPYNESLVKQDWAGLQDKFWQLRNESGASIVQMELLSPRSRAKLNLISGDALQYLQNRTDGQFAEILESIRATNFRRAMAINVIFSSLRSAFTSGNVLGMLQALQVEDLERLASLPLSDKKYQALTNVTLLGMLEEIYGYGQTQVKKRTCVLTAANTSTVVPLINGATTSLARHRRSLRSTIDQLAQSAAEIAAIRVRHLLDEGAISEAVIAATQDEFLLEPATFFRDFRGSRKLAQQIDSATPAEDDNTVAFLVMNFMRRMGINGSASAERGRQGDLEGNPPAYLMVPPPPPGAPIAGSDGRIFTPLNFTDESDFAEQFTANGEELPPPEYANDYEEDPCANATAAEALGINCTASYDYSLDYGSPNTPDGLDTLDDADLLLPDGDANQTEVEECTTERVANTTMVTVICRNGTTNTIRKDPCLERDANGTLLEPEACKALGKCTRNNTYVHTGEPCDYNATHPCRQRRIMGTTMLTVSCNNGTTYNYTRDPCNFRKNGTVVHAAACAALGPCLPNNTYTNSGERCKYNVSVSRRPCVNGVRNGTDVPCNSSTANSTAPSGNSTTESGNANLPCVNGTLNGTDTPCNVTEATLEVVPCVNGTRNGTDIPCTEQLASDSNLPCINGTLNGTNVPCNASNSEFGAGANRTGVLPCVNGREEGTGAPCNSSEASWETSGSLPCVDGYLNGTDTPCNSTGALNSTGEDSSNSTVPCVNGTLDGTGVPCTVDETFPANTTTEAGAGEANSTLPCADGVLEGTDIPCEINNSTANASNSTTDAGNSTIDVLGPDAVGNATDLQSNGTTTTPESGLPSNCFEVATGMVICNSPESGNATATVVNSTADEPAPGPQVSEDGNSTAVDSNTTGVLESPLPGDLTTTEPSPSPAPSPTIPDYQLSPAPGIQNSTEISTDQPSPSPSVDGAVDAGESPIPSESPETPTLDGLLLGQLGPPSPSPGPSSDIADPLLPGSSPVSEAPELSPSPDPATATDQQPDVPQQADDTPAPAPEPVAEPPASSSSPELGPETYQQPEFPQPPETTSSPPDSASSPEPSPESERPVSEYPSTPDPGTTPDPPSEPESGTDPCISVSCGEHGTCNMGVCECTGGWAGTLCEVPPATQQEDPCAMVNCGSHGSCDAGACTCSDGYTGTLCDTPPLEAPIELDSCATVNCGVHGTCSSGVCSCSDGYTGTFCDTPPDPCVAVSCGVHGTCSSGTCNCLDGYSGAFCDTPPDPCAAVSCGVHGTCSSGTCNCLDGYSGAFCDTPPDPCAAVSCGVHGTCSSGTCNCLDGYSGAFCDTPPDPCAAVSCGVHGTCSGGTCNCLDGYTGAFCDTPPDLCAGKSCSGHGTCSSGVCSCSDGWSGADCEVAPAAAPEPQPETVIPTTEPAPETVISTTDPDTTAQLTDQPADQPTDYATGY